MRRPRVDRDAAVMRAVGGVLVGVVVIVASYLAAVHVRDEVVIALYGSGFVLAAAAASTPERRPFAWGLALTLLTPIVALWALFTYFAAVVS